MRPISFLYYSLIGILDLAVLLFWLGVIKTWTLEWFRAAIKITFEERKNFLDELDQLVSRGQAESYNRTMH